jgi:hypothetical protein
MSGPNKHVVLPNGVVLDMGDLGKVNLRGQRPTTVETTEVKPAAVGPVPTDAPPPAGTFKPAAVSTPVVVASSKPTETDKRRAKSTLVEAAAAAKAEAEALRGDEHPALWVIEDIISKLMDPHLLQRAYIMENNPDAYQELPPWNQAMSQTLVEFAGHCEADEVAAPVPGAWKVPIVLRYVARKLWADPDYELTQRELDAVCAAAESKPVWFGKAVSVNGVTVGQKVEMQMSDLWVLVAACLAVFMTISTYFVELDNLRQSQHWFTWAWSNLAMVVTMVFLVPSALFLFWSPVIWMQIKIRDKRYEHEFANGYETSGFETTNARYALGVLWRTFKVLAFISICVMTAGLVLLFVLLLGGIALSRKSK